MVPSGGGAGALRGGGGIGRGSNGSAHGGGGTLRDFDTAKAVEVDPRELDAAWGLQVK
jgi:hypothetical protein